MAKADLRTPFTIGDLAVAPGATARAEVPVARLATGTWLSLPVMVVHGRRGGPTLWLSAALHGDELNGVGIIRGVLEGLDPGTVRGTVLAVPVVNVFGFVAESRYLPDRRDLNRSFPGSAKGSLASRLAHLFLNEVVKRCTYGIDLHTGSDHRDNLPHVRGDLDQADVLAMARAFGMPLMIHGAGPDGSLRQAASAEGIACLVYEAGEANRFDDTAIREGVRGIRRVLASLKMISPVAKPTVRPRRIDKMTWVRARRSGIARLSVNVGATVKKDQVIGEIVDTFGEALARVRVSRSGIVLGINRHPLVHRGEALVHLAVTRPTSRAKR